ncbi:MAG: hypothetical protein ACE3L7_10650 [Candidatus Pristimantibacillus sp.]
MSCLVKRKLFFLIVLIVTLVVPFSLVGIRIAYAEPYPIRRLSSMTGASRSMMLWHLMRVTRTMAIRLQIGPQARGKGV